MSDGKELTFWEHLDELRKVLVRVLCVWFVLAVVYFAAMPYLFDKVVLAPCNNDFVFYHLLRSIGEYFHLKDEFFTQEFHVKLVNINLAAPFLIHMSTAFWMSVVTAAPYVFYEIWRFVSPALYPNEMRGVRKALGIGTVMFFVGVLLGYFMVYPLTLRFLSTYQLSALVENQISLNSYIDNFMMLILCMGGGVRIAVGDVVAVPAGHRAQAVVAQVSPSCGGADRHCGSGHYPYGRPLYAGRRIHPPLFALRVEHPDDQGQTC